MTEETKAFTVSDRRHFTSEGSVRDEDRAERSPDPEVGPTPARRPGDDRAEEDPIDFSTFLLSLGAQVAALLTGEREGADRSRRLREARSLISIIEMLKDKTEGRRTEDEERVMEGLLYELRMTYVSAARADGA
ncbi:MAG: DUF1844 domain-containing protein [Vicinamibacteria bacterium]